MDRYTYIYGTVESGPYGPMGSSANLPGFLSKIGAVNPGATIDIVRNEICGFKELTGYELQPKNSLPVAIRYAPFHLYKRPDMPKAMQPFCALTVSGSEHRPGGRNSVFSQTVFIAREHMHGVVTVVNKNETVTFSYLDQLFGTRPLTHEDMNYHRTGKITVDYDALPEKVTPDLRPQDRQVVFNAVNAVYEDKAVIIRIEKGYAFNSRARQLLIQIYSLLQPHLAAETGFATYQDSGTIKELVTNTSMRIFILPAEQELKPEQAEGMLVMDLENPESVPAMEDKELEKQLKKWCALSWPQRQVAMEKLFADTIINYREKALFLQRSQDFFADPFFVWERSNEDQGAVKTLDELKEKQTSFPLTEQIPWVTERFKNKIDFIMQQGQLKKLTADAIAMGLFAKDEEEKKRQRRRYLYGAEMGGSDVIEACKSTGALVDKQVREECAIELNAQKEQTAKAIADGKAALTAEQERAATAAATAAAVLAEEKAAHKQDVDTLNTAHSKEKEEMTAEFTTKYNDLESAAKKRISDMKERHAKELEDKDAAYTVALQTEKDTVERVSKKLKEKSAEATELETQLKDAKEDVATKDTRIRSLESKLRKASAGSKSTKSLLIGIAIGFGAALLIASIVFGIIALVGGGNANGAVDDTRPTVTETIPEITDAPKAEETTENTAQAIIEEPIEDDFNWVIAADNIFELTAVETDADAIAQILFDCELPAGEVQLVATTSKNGFNTKTTEFIVVLKTSTTPDNEAANLETITPRKADNSIDVDDYCILIFGDEQLYAVAEKLANQFNNKFDWIFAADTIPELTAVETDTDAIAQILVNCELPAGEVQLVATTSKNGFNTKTTEFIVVLKTSTTPDNDAANLETITPRKADNSIDVDDYCILVFGHEQLYAVAEKLANQFRKLDWIAATVKVSELTAVETDADAIAQILVNCELPAGEVQLVATISEDGFKATPPDLIVVLKKSTEAADDTSSNIMLRQADSTIDLEDYCILIFGDAQSCDAAMMLSKHLSQ